MSVAHRPVPGNRDAPSDAGVRAREHRARERPHRWMRAVLAAPGADGPSSTGGLIVMRTRACPHHGNIQAERFERDEGNPDGCPLAVWRVEDGPEPCGQPLGPVQIWLSWRQPVTSPTASEPDDQLPF